MIQALAGAAAGTLAAVLGRIFAWVIGGLIFRVITSFGIGIVVFWGVGELFDNVLGEIQAMSTGLPPVMAKLIISMRIDDGITVVFSAISIRVAMKTFGLAGGLGTIFARGGLTP